MRLGSRRARHRDGRLVLVSPDLRRALPVPDIAATVQDALDRWSEVEDALRAADARLRSGAEAGEELADGDLLAALPRAYGWIDCGGYPHPLELLARLQGSDPPDAQAAAHPAFHDGTSQFLASGAPVSTLGSDELDIEAELGFVLGDLGLGATEKEAGAAIVGVTVVNDLTLRDVLRADLGASKGIYHAKPRCSMAPTIVTLDELGDAWDGELLHARMHSWVNGREIGHPDTGVDAGATVPDLIAQATRSRPLCAGTVVATGTVSNRDPEVGSACLGELQLREALAEGSATTPYLRPGDELTIDLRTGNGSVAGPLHHLITAD